MVLCELPEDRALRRDAYFRNKREKLARDIERNIASINRTIPKHAGFGRITKTSSTTILRERKMPAEAGEFDED